MTDTAHHSTPAPARPRRFWLAEALIVAGILAFGGFALMSDAGLSPVDLFSDISTIAGR
jgi:hypothetical protein